MIKLPVSRRRTLSILVVLLLASSFMPVAVARWVSHVPVSVVSAVLTPVKPPLHQLALAIRAPRSVEPSGAQIGLDDYETLQRLYWQKEMELQAAHETIDRLSLVRRELDLVATKLLEAAVASPTPHPRYPSLSINKGTIHGIEVGQVVCAGDNLVGRISHASATSATVKLVSRSSAHLEVLIMHRTIDGASRRAKSQLSFDAGLAAFIDLISGDRVAGVQVGDLARLADPRWPKHAQGLVIGKVERIENLPNDVRQKRVLVVPREELIRLAKVVVMMPERGG